MKKTIAYSAVLFFSLLLLLSCSKNSKDSLSPTTVKPDRLITAKVAQGQTYVLDVAIKGNLGIIRQAAHYSVSETGIAENGHLIYKYMPAAGFNGEDEVLLSHSTEAEDDISNGCNYGESRINISSSTIAFKITVAD
jgi:hypothetical protein